MCLAGCVATGGGAASVVPGAATANGSI